MVELELLQVMNLVMVLTKMVSNKFIYSDEGLHLETSIIRFPFAFNTARVSLMHILYITTKLQSWTKLLGHCLTQ